MLLETMPYFPQLNAVPDDQNNMTPPRRFDSTPPPFCIKPVPKRMSQHDNDRFAPKGILESCIVSDSAICDSAIRHASLLTSLVIPDDFVSNAAIPSFISSAVPCAPCDKSLPGSTAISDDDDVMTFGLPISQTRSRTCGKRGEIESRGQTAEPAWNAHTTKAKKTLKGPRLAVFREHGIVRPIAKRPRPGGASASEDATDDDDIAFGLPISRIRTHTRGNRRRIEASGNAAKSTWNAHTTSEEAMRKTPRLMVYREHDWDKPIAKRPRSSTWKGLC